jgi:toluene monooxygenase system protein E
MAEQAGQARRRQRTWSAFGDVRRMPSEYEIVTHGTNWTLREGRKAAFEQNPSSPGNLWYRTYRDLSPLQAEDWDAFRDPDAMIYRKYVAMQHEQENAISGVLDEYSDGGHDAKLSREWLATLEMMLCTTRFPLHASQQVQAYIGMMAPSPYITNCLVFSAADLLGRVSLVAYRTRELDLSHPEHGFGAGERALWQDHEAWQPTRELAELALATYDWAEAFTAMNLVILPTLDDILLRQLREIARDVGDELTWLLLGYLTANSERRARWSTALAKLALAQRPDNLAVFEKWIGVWAPQADAAARGLAGYLAASGHVGSADSVVRAAEQAREQVLTEAGLRAAQPAEDSPAVAG